jgi:hypothetical protein
VAGFLGGGGGQDSREALGALSRLLASDDSSDQMYTDKATENIDAGLGFRVRYRKHQCRFRV